MFTDNGYTISVEPSEIYISVPEITSGDNKRAAGGLIVLDNTSEVKFDKSLNFTTFEYFVGMDIYFADLSDTSAYVLFSINILLRTSPSTVVDYYLSLSMSRISPTSIIIYIGLFKDTFGTAKGVIITQNIEGWQTMRLYFKNEIVSGSVINTLELTIYDSNGDLQTHTLSVPWSSTVALITEASIGSLYRTTQLAKTLAVISYL